MTTIPTPTLPKASYILHKPLPDGLFLARRTTDGEILLARPLDPRTTTSPIADRTRHSNREHVRLMSLMASGAATPAANLLNHENIVSIHDELVDVPLHLREQGDADAGYLGDPLHDGTARRMFLWDFPDAGTLRDVLEDFAPRGAGVVDFVEMGGFLPESFVWHVGLGLLRALQWLHEGVRDTYAVGPDAGSVKGFRRLRGKTEAEADWMPVLHRGLKPENVFLQHPKGFETYGAVKLGSFEKCYISGSVAKMKDTPVMAMETEDVPLGTLRERKGRWKRDGMDVARSERPYTRGSELFAVGTMLYRMMCGRGLPSAEECPNCGCVHLTSNDATEYTPCTHDCVGDVNINTVFDPLFNYTAGLKNLITLLLRLDRNEVWAASDVLNTTAWPGFEYWAANTDDGQLYRDIFDDIWLRKQNQSRLKKRRRVEEEEEEEEEEEYEGMDLDENILVV